MNNLKYRFLLTSLLGLSLISCEDDYYYFEDSTLSLKPHYVATDYSNIYFNGEGSSATMWVKSEDTPWQLSNMPDWISASPARGSSDMEVILDALANPLGYERTAIFSLESNDPEYRFSQDITAVQYGGEPYIYFGSNGNTELYVPPTVTGAAQTVGIPMYTNLNQIWWKMATTSAPKPVNLTINVQANKMNVELSENSTNDVVSYPLAITPYEKVNPFTRYVTIYQDPAAFKSIDHTYFNVSARATSVQFIVDSEVEWKATCTNSWINLSTYTGGIGKETVKVNILENASTSNRRGTITMYSAGNKLLQIIEINQTGMQVSFSINSVDFSEQESSQTVTITSDMDWTATSMPSWVKAEPKSGKVGSTDIKVSVEANNSVSPRSGEISFSAASNVYKLKVTQKGLPFSISEKLVCMPWKSSSADVELTCNGKWTANCDQAWLTVSPTTGNNSGKLKLTTTDNATDKARSATVRIVSDKEQLTVLVIQYPQVFTIESTSGNFNVNGGTVSVTYRSNVSGTCSVTPDPEANDGTDWIVCKHQADTKNDNSDNNDYAITNTFTFTAAPNKSSKPRAAYADMKPKDGNNIDEKTYRLHLRQPGRSIQSNVSKISFFYNGGVSPEYSVKADGQFEMAFVGDNHSWLTLDILGNNRDWFKVSAAPNTSNQVRSAILRISLKDLPAGEEYHLDIPVIQYPEGVVIVKDNWGSDENWGFGDGEDILKIKLKEWSEDKNWNI